MGFVHLILNATALGQLKLLFDLIKILWQLYPGNYLDFIHKSDSTDDNAVGISLEVKKILELVLQNIVFCVQTVRIELLIEGLLYQQVISKAPSYILFAGRLEIQDDNCKGKFLFEAPTKRLA